MKKVFYILLLLSMLALSACDGAKTGNSVLPKRGDSGSDTAGKATDTSGAESTGGSLIPKRNVTDSDTGVPAYEPDREAYTTEALSGSGAEDENEYGTSPGNIYNDGQMAEYIDGQYFLCTYLNENYLVDGKWGYFLNAVRLRQMNYVRGRLCGIHTDAERAYNGTLLVYDVTRKTSTGYLNRKPVLLYAVDGILYYTDADTHMLLSFDPVEGTERIIVDDKVGDFTIFKDRIIFCNEADDGRLYSIPLSGGNAVRLNDRKSRNPIVYDGTVFFAGEAGGTEKIHIIGLDGEGEAALFTFGFQSPVVCGSRLCFLSPDYPAQIATIDLTKDPANMKIEMLDFSEELYGLLSRELGGFGSYRLTKVSSLANIYGKLMFRTYYVNDNENEYVDGAEYDFEAATIALSTMFEGQASQPYSEYDADNPNMMVFNESETASESLGLTPSNGHNYYSSLTAEQAEQADKIALEIAEDVLSDSSYSTDLDMVNAAAKAVNRYCTRGSFEADADNAYRSPYGVFIARKWSSAGAARALGRVLDYMGFPWTQVNDGTGEHQYCEVVMDAQKGFADASVGGAGYGEWSGSYYFQDDHIWTKAQP